MTNVQSHAPGSFSWVELATTDQDAAKKFYSSIFGWNVNDNPMGPSGTYTIFRLHERDAAAAYTLRKEDRDRHVPPHWELYIAVDNADQAASKAATLGGAVCAPAFDVADIGRMAVLQDPTGAIFCVWQAKKQAGLGVTGEHNSFCWADLSTPDPEKAGKFYSGLFGWKLDKSEKDPSGYLHIKNGEKYIGGIPPAAHRDPKVPAHWLVYFDVADVDASTTQARHIGAQVHMPPRKMEGVGTFAILADPQGAVFALFKSDRAFSL
jgi:uncharacterized protein